MDVHTGRRDNRTLRRIIATLIALAVLAERVSTRSLPVRWLVLMILRQAESVAWEFATEATRVPPPAVEETRALQNGPADAILLASRFRALAAMLGAMLSLAYRATCSNARIDGAPHQFAPDPRRLAVTLDCWQPKPNDTS